MMLIEQRYISLGVLDGLNYDGTRLAFLPYGDYVETATKQFMYSFLVTDLGGVTRAFVKHSEADIDEALTAATAAEVKEYTIYHPLSLI